MRKEAEKEVKPVLINDKCIDKVQDSEKTTDSYRV